MVIEKENQLKNKESRLSFKNSFYSNEQRIPINGLIWMGSVDQMITQLEDKIKEGYEIVKNINKYFTIDTLNLIIVIN